MISRSNGATTLASTHFRSSFVPIPFVPLVDLPSYALAVRLVFFARLDKQLGAVSRPSEMALQVLPAAVGLESAVRVGAAVGSEGLRKLLVGFKACSGKAVKWIRKDGIDG